MIYRIVCLTVPLNCGVWLFYRIQNQKILKFFVIRDFCFFFRPIYCTGLSRAPILPSSFSRNCAYILC